MEEEQVVLPEINTSFLNQNDVTGKLGFVMALSLCSHTLVSCFQDPFLLPLGASLFFF